MRGLDFLHFCAYNGVMNYTPYATDQYMRSVLIDEFSDDEADNALTALSALTSIYPSYYPSERTFVKTHHHRGSDRAIGVRFVVYGEDGIERSVFLPREDLADIGRAIDAVDLAAAIWILPV